MHRPNAPLLSRTLVAASIVWGVSAAAPCPAQIHRLPSPDSTAGNHFGTAVAIDGDRIVVGATGADVCGPNSGAAYVYERSGEFTWRLEAVLQPEDCEEQDFFGRAVAVAGDRIAVTSYRPYFSTFRSNAVHLFERDEDGNWERASRIEAPGGAAEGAFAASIALGEDRFVVTSLGETRPDGHRGGATVYERGTDGAWVVAARLEGDADGRAFGASCALDGEFAAVSASSASRRVAGTVLVFEREADGRWVRRATFSGIRDFFIPMALDAGRLLVGQRDGGHSRSGVATLYEPGPDGAWHRTARLRPPVPYPSGGFGSGISLTGEHALVVGFDEQLQFDFNIDRVVYVFSPDESGAWSQRQVIDLGETHFGSAIDADGALAVIGSAADGRPGAAYVVGLR